MADKKLKVVHVSTSYSGGAGTAAYRIHEALLLNNIHSTFLTLDASVPENSSNCFHLPMPEKSLLSRATDKLARIAANSLGLNLSNDIYYQHKLTSVRPSLHCEWTSLPFSSYDILAHTAVQDADVIHLHWVAGMLDYPYFFKKNSKAVVWTLHDMNPLQGIFHYKGDEVRNEQTAKPFDRKIYSIKENAIKSRKCSLLIVTPSHWLRKTAIESPVFANVPATTIQNPINASEFFPTANEALKIKLQIPSNNTVFLFIAQAVETYRKGFDLLIDALSQLQPDNVTLLVIGDSFQSNHVSRHVVILGTVRDKNELRDYYSLADAFVIPSREDNLPNVMLEAMACGTPVLSFNIGGMAEIITDNFNGMMAPEISSTSLKDVLERFITRKREFDSEAIRQFAVQNFSYSLIAEKYKTAYEKSLT